MVVGGYDRTRSNRAPTMRCPLPTTHYPPSTVHHPPSTVDEFLNIVILLIPSITAFFDKVLVMAEDPKVRENRLGLLQSIAALSTGIADLSKLTGF